MDLLMFFILKKVVSFYKPSEESWTVFLKNNRLFLLFIDNH